MAMRRFRAFWIRLRGMAGGLIGAQRDGDFAAEIESHVAMHTDDGIRAGLSPAEARRQALIRLGGEEQTRQAYRERVTVPWLENLLRDVRYALRGFRRNPAFTVTVIATLALGIGATTAVFSVVDRILFRSLPYAHDDRIVSVGLVQSLEKQEFMLGGFFYDWRDNQKPFEAFASQGTMLHACDLVEANPAQLNCIQRASRLSASAGDFARARTKFSARRGPAQRTARRADLLRLVAGSLQSRSGHFEPADRRGWQPGPRDWRAAQRL